MDITILFDQVLKQYAFSPPTLKRVETGIKEVLTTIRDQLKKHHIDAEVMLGGSAAKGTFIKNDFDCDVFVRFHYSYVSENISEILEKILKPFKPARVHGSRNYFQFTFKKIPFEIIPVLKVNDPKKAVNVTDMSPLHVAWVKKHMTPELRREIILAKLFCKAQGLYGAESYINGFSGHVLDILIIYYGSFLKLLKANQNWKLRQVIDVEKHNTASQLNASKIAPLIVIDPMQPERNAAAALSEEKFTSFKKVSSAFLKRPSLEFFIPQHFDVSKLKKEAGKNSFFVFDVIGFSGKEDVIGAKILKVFEHFNKHLRLHQFTILVSGWEFDKKQKAKMWFSIRKEARSKTIEQRGPPLTTKIGCEQFRKKHKNVFVKGKYLYAVVPRPYLTVQSLFDDLIKDEFSRERVKKVKQV